MVSITRCRVRIACLLALICSWPGAPLAQPGPRPDPKAVIPPRAKGAPKRAPKRAPKPALPAFQQQWLTPYLQQGKVAAARQALVARKPAEAARRLSRYLARKDAPWRLQARFLLGHAYLRTGRYRKAAKLFGALWRQYPLLADYHLFYEARARYRLKEYQACVSLTAKVAVTSALATDASLLRADALRRLGRVEEAAGLWKRYLDAGAGKRRRGEAHFRLGQAKEKEAAGQTTAAKRRALQARAMRHYKQVLVLSPGSRLEAPARRGIAALAARGAGKVKLSPWEAYGRASVFFRRMRNRTSERAFARLLRRKKLAKKLRCMASYRMARSVFKQRQRARAEPMYRKAAAACRAAGLTDMVVKSLYSGARGLSRGRKFRKAIARYGLIEKEFSKHSYADDARLRAAEVYVEMGNKRAARKLLATIPSRYPDGDMIREALWRLARDAYQARRYKKATRYLDRIIKRLGRATIYYAHGRALYWKARIQQKRKRSAAARKLYARCIREYPLSYYALQSFNRLREGHRATFAKLVKKHIDGTGLKPGRWTFAARALFAKPSFLRGVELARLGFGNDAARELAAAGIKIKKGVKPEDMWLAAVLYDRAGIWRNSHQVPRSKDMRYRSWTEDKRPERNAVIIYMMDVSGSMGADQKEIVRMEAFWIDTWLQSQYDGLETRYIIHDASAREVDKDTFFHTRESGGTLISTAYKLCQKMIDEDYPSSEWNIYPFHFSDGDNWSGSDTRDCLALLKERMLPDVNAFCYGQVESEYGSGQFYKDLEGEFGGDSADERVILSRIDDKDAVMDSIKTFLGKGR